MTQIFIARQGSLIPLEDANRAAFPWAAPVFDFVDWFRNGGQEWTLHTSGSTGEPKVIRWQRDLMDYSSRKTFAFTQLPERPLTWIPISCEHAGGIMMLHRALLLGAEAWISQPGSDPFVQLPKDRTPQFASLVPLQLEVLKNNPEYQAKFAAIPTVLIGGAAISASLAELLGTLDNHIFHTYGMTETYSHIALRRLSRHPHKWFQLTDPDMSIRGENDGTIGLKGVITGNEWLKTNDLAEIASHGKKFRILGRADDIINSGGIKINPQEIEAVFQKWMHQNRIGLRFAVIGVPDEQLGSKVVAVVENKSGADFVVNSWRAALKDKLPPYYFPKTLISIENWPEAANGKTDRTAIRERVLNLT